MLARSFGLLGDWVRELEIVDYKGDVVKVIKDSHPDLLYGFLGGSTGNPWCPDTLQDWSSG